jgi:hypothetical protein
VKPKVDISSDWTDCPATIDSIEDFLDLEDLERHPESLSFFFRATAESKKLWVWKYLDRRDEINYVAIVQVQPPERFDMYEIGCGPAGEPNESESMALSMFARAGLW